MTSSEWDLPLGEDTMKLGKFSKVRMDSKNVYIHNGKAKLVYAYLDSTSEDLRESFIKIGYSDSLADKLCNRIISALGEYMDEQAQKQYKSEDEKDGPKPRIVHTHKYSKGIPLIESVIVDGKPYFIQMTGSGLDFNLLHELPINHMFLRPQYAYLSDTCKYVFESREEIEGYLRLASEKTANRNFDPIFKLIKTIFTQYVKLEDHDTTRLVATIIYTYFQDHFGITHYDFLVGDNGSGKNSVLTTMAWLSYRMFLASSVNGPNIFTFLANIEACQGTLALDEVDNLDNEHDTMNILKSGYSRDSGRVPRTDLSSGRTQDAWWTFCYKVFASERDLDSKARGLLDRCFITRCLVGKPKYNIKKVSDKSNKHLKEELERARKLLLACRMVHYNDTIEEIGLNIINREAELTEHLLRTFQHSQDTMKELKPALTKSLNTKRKLKSDSIEAYLYKTIKNLFEKNKEKITNGVLEVSNESIREELKSITNGEDILGKSGKSGKHTALRLDDLGIEISYDQITKRLIEILRAEPIPMHIGDKKGRGIRITKENFERKGIEFDVPDEIMVSEYKNPIPGPDNFESILLNGRSWIDRTGGTLDKNNDNGQNEEIRAHIASDGTGGTGGTPLDETRDKNEGVNETSRAQITSDIEPKDGLNESSTSNLSPSHASHASQRAQILGQSDGEPSQPSEDRSGHEVNKNQLNDEGSLTEVEENYDTYVARQKEKVDSIEEHSLTKFGFDDPIGGKDTVNVGTTDGSIAADTKSSSEVKETTTTSLPTDRIQAKTNEQQSASEEWQIFGKLENDEMQSGLSIEISIPQNLFHEALESSGKFVVGDIPQIIEAMNLETVCIEKDGQYIYCYRRK
jgi:hypothetical protein